MAESARDRERVRASFLEKLILPAVQTVTDHLHPPDHTPAPSSLISVGHAPSPTHPRQAQEQTIALSDMVRHGYLCGATGSGKTFGILIILTALVRLLCGFTVIDVTGDLTRMLLALFAVAARDPAMRAIIRERLVYLDPFDPTWALAFNPLAADSPQRIYVLVGDLVARLRTRWADSWGPRMEEILANCLLALALSHRPLADAPRFLVDGVFRHQIVETLADPIVRAFWLQQFERQSDNAKLTAVQPVLNKIRPLVSDFHLRHTLSIPDSRIHFRRDMDRGAWTLINVSKGTAGQAALGVGSMCTSHVWAAAQSRIDIPETERILHVLVCDEFQNFLSTATPFTEVLSESRKFKLGLLMANQFLRQLDPTTRDAIFGNVGTAFFFRLGFHDAPHVARAFQERIRPQVTDALLSLQVGQAVRRLDDGDCRVVRMHRINAPQAAEAEIQALRQASFDRYYLRRADVDRQLSAALSDEPILRPPVRLRVPIAPDCPSPARQSVMPEGEL